MSIDPRKFEELVKTHATVIAAAVRRVCMRRYESLIPDVTQEVHLKLWKVLESGKKIDNPPSYIYRVALTTGLTMVEKAKKQSVIAQNLEQELRSVPADDSTVAERSRLIDELLEQLQPDHSNALRAYLAGYNHLEIAKLFDWSESVARHNVYRTIEKLKAFMATNELTQEGANHE